MRNKYWLVLLFFVLVMYILSQTPFSWNRWAPEPCRLQNCYCEPFRIGYFVLQPFTAFSNLGYILAGLLIISNSKKRVSASRSAANWMIANRVWATGYGICLLITGWFSFFSHASLTRLGEWFDLMGVYVLIGYLIATNLHRLGLAPQRIAPLFASLLIVLGFQMVFKSQWQQIMIAILLVGTVFTEVLVRLQIQPHSQYRLLFVSLVLFAMGAGIWAANGRSPRCPPGAFPWHIAWHLLSAASAFILFQYYWQERVREQGNLPMHSH